MGSLGPLPTLPNTDQVHHVPAWAPGAKFWLPHQPSVCTGSAVPRGGVWGVVLGLLFTP